jgi:hypothetical protein
VQYENKVKTTMKNKNPLGENNFEVFKNIPKWPFVDKCGMH